MTENNSSHWRTLMNAVIKQIASTIDIKVANSNPDNSTNQETPGENNNTLVFSDPRKRSQNDKAFIEGVLKLSQQPDEFDASKDVLPKPK